MADLTKVMDISTAGMEAQGTRLRTIAENIANANSMAQTPGGDPYRRKLITFKSEMDRSSGSTMVKVDRITRDNTDFTTKFEPGNPSADAQGYVKMPNVNPLIEAMDMREAERSYDANVQMVTVSKAMLSKTINLLQ